MGDQRGGDVCPSQAGRGDNVRPPGRIGVAQRRECRGNARAVVGGGMGDEQPLAALLEEGAGCVPAEMMLFELRDRRERAGQRGYVGSQADEPGGAGRHTRNRVRVERRLLDEHPRMKELGHPRSICRWRAIGKRDMRRR